jgi:hypothetical protein
MWNLVLICIPAIVRLAEPIALTSIFPYAWPLVKKFKVGEEEDVSRSNELQFRPYSPLLLCSLLKEILTSKFCRLLSTPDFSSPPLRSPSR